MSLKSYVALTGLTRPTEGPAICANFQPQKATPESRNFPPLKSRNLKISEKNQTKKQPTPNKTKTSRRILRKFATRVLLQKVSIYGY
jgi:hypothetical protein